MPVGGQPNDIAAGDFGNDGHIDLVATLSTDLAAVLGNDGAGGFTLGTVATYPGPTGVAVLDANRDALLDFATTSTSGGTMRIHFNNGSGFGAIGYGGVGGYADMASADLNRDGAPDIVLVNSTANQLTIRFNTGAGSYYSAITTMVGMIPSAVVAGDWNRDGILDLAVTNRSSDTVSLLRGNGTTFSTPPFTATATLPTGDQPNAVISQDIDNDGRLDLVVAYQAAASVTVFRGNGDGTFAPGQATGPAIASRGLSAGDFNQDGRADLAVADLLGDTVHMLLSDCPVGPVAPSLTYLPMIRSYNPVLATINAQPIPVQPIAGSGVTYYTTTIQLAGPLPAEGRFYFSSSPAQVQPIYVDDELVVTVNGQERFVRIATEPLIGEVPRAEIAQWVGQEIVVTFRDTVGIVIGSDPVWLIWVP